MSVAVADTFVEEDPQANLRQLKAVIECTAQLFGVDPADVVQPSLEMAQPREMAIYLARQCSKSTFHEISRHLNCSDAIAERTYERTVNQAAVEPKFRQTLGAAADLVSAYQSELGTEHHSVGRVALALVRPRKYAYVIKEEAARVAGVTVSDLEGPTRDQPTAQARQLTMYLVMSLCNMSSSEAATFVNRRHHTTALYAKDQIETKMEEDPTFREYVERLRNGAIDLMMQTHHDATKRLVLNTQVVPGNLKVRQLDRDALHQREMQRVQFPESQVAQADPLPNGIPLATKNQADIAVTIAAVAYGIAPRDIFALNKGQCEPRQVAMYLLAKHSSMSSSEVARFFGKKDHTTVLYARDKITAECSHDPDLAARVVPAEAAFTAIVGSRMPLGENLGHLHQMREAISLSGVKQSYQPSMSHFDKSHFAEAAVSALRPSASAKVNITVPPDAPGQMLFDANKWGASMKAYVASTFGLTAAVLDQQNPPPRIAVVREIAMHVVAELTGGSQRDIAQVFAEPILNVARAMARVTDRMGHDQKYKTTIEECTTKVRDRFENDALRAPAFDLAKATGNKQIEAPKVAAGPDNVLRRASASNLAALGRALASY